jgi:hypothetical protein
MKQSAPLDPPRTDFRLLNLLRAIEVAFQWFWRAIVYSPTSRA